MIKNILENIKDPHLLAFCKFSELSKLENRKRIKKSKSQTKFKIHPNRANNILVMKFLTADL